MEIKIDGSHMTAVLNGDIDHHSARGMRRELDDMIARCQPELLIIDMSGVDFMDSSGVGLILGRLRAVRAYGGDVAVRGASQETAAVIKLSGLSGLITEVEKNETGVT